MPRQHFSRKASAWAARILPLNLWVDFRLVEGDDRTHSLFTTGLAAFGQREVEILE